MYRPRVLARECLGKPFDSGFQIKHTGTREIKRGVKHVSYLLLGMPESYKELLLLYDRLIADAGCLLQFRCILFESLYRLAIYQRIVQRCGCESFLYFFLFCV